MNTMKKPMQQYLFFDKDGGSYKSLTDSGCTIKIRGNTTAGAPKKPWNIKLSSRL